MSAVAACPACPGGASVEFARGRTAEVEGEVVQIALPGVHCAACIAGVERVLAATPGVRAARVNLGARRVRVVAAPGQGAGPALEALRGAGWEAHELDPGVLARGGDPEGRALLARIAVAGFAAMNVMALSVAVWSGAGEATRALFHWVSAAIALPALAFAAVPFFASAWGALRGGRVNMDVPIALAIGLAAAASLSETMAAGGTGRGADTWFDAALSLTFFLLVGRYLEHRARSAARGAAAELAALELPRATRIEGDARVTVAVVDIRPGDRIALAPGARAPVDGAAEASATLDRSALTGEAAPVAVAAGQTICAGEIVLGAPLVVRASARAEDSTLRRLAALVEVAETGRHRHSGIADRVARAYAPLVHTLAAAAFAGWWAASGDAHLALGVAMAVLIITCPCALALAVPAVTASVTGRLFRGGMLLTSATALERLAEVDCVLLDKTGTLTEGVAELPTLDPGTASVALALARVSDHPVARAVAAALAGTVAAEVEDLREVSGEGVHGVRGGVPVFLGRGEGGTVIQVGAVSTPLPMVERLRPGAAEMVAGLVAAGYDVRLVTGDNAAAAAMLAVRLGIDRVHSGLGPEAKGALIDELAGGGAKVLMVGDGINDALALTRAHVSLAPASALDAARVAADGVILTRDLAEVPRTLQAAKGALLRIRQNLGLALTYNAVAVPLALAGFATPLMAAVAMSSSSLAVVANAVRR